MTTFDVFPLATLLKIMGIILTGLYHNMRDPSIFFNILITINEIIKSLIKKLNIYLQLISQAEITLRRLHQIVCVR